MNGQVDAMYWIGAPNNQGICNIRAIDFVQSTVFGPLETPCEDPASTQAYYVYCHLPT